MGGIYLGDSSPRRLVMTVGNSAERMVRDHRVTTRLPMISCSDDPENSERRTLCRNIQSHVEESMPSDEVVEVVTRRAKSTQAAAEMIEYLSRAEGRVPSSG